MEHTQTYLTAANTTGAATHTGNLVLQGQDITITIPDVVYGPKAEYNMIYGFAEVMNRGLLAQVRKIGKPLENYNHLPLLEHINNQAAYMLNLLKPRNRGSIPQIAYHNQPLNHDDFMTFGIDVTA